MRDLVIQELIWVLQRENVGAVDAGIKAAVWSPDEELLALVTGELYLLRKLGDNSKF